MNYNLLSNTEQQMAKAYLDKLIASKSKCTITKVVEKRSNSQNRYVHLLFSMFGAFFGYTLEESKVVVKTELGCVYEKNGIKFLKSTGDFNKEEMMEFIEKFRAYSSMNGCYLPSADEYDYNPSQMESYVKENSYFV